MMIKSIVKVSVGVLVFIASAACAQETLKLASIDGKSLDNKELAKMLGVSVVDKEFIGTNKSMLINFIYQYSKITVENDEMKKRNIVVRDDDLNPKDILEHFEANWNPLGANEGEREARLKDVSRQMAMIYKAFLVWKENELVGEDQASRLMQQKLLTKPSWEHIKQNADNDAVISELRRAAGYTKDDLYKQSVHAAKRVVAKQKLIDVLLGDSDFSSHVDRVLVLPNKYKTITIVAGKKSQYGTIEDFRKSVNQPGKDAGLRNSRLEFPRLDKSFQPSLVSIDAYYLALYIPDVNAIRPGDCSAEFSAPMAGGKTQLMCMYVESVVPRNDADIVPNNVDDSVRKAIEKIIKNIHYEAWLSDQLKARLVFSERLQN